MVVAADKAIFVKDDGVEAWLKSWDIDFSGPVSVQVSQIDIRTSRLNQARPEAVVDDARDSYSTAIANGIDLPAIVVYKKGNKWTIVDGNNRVAAAQKRKHERVNAYVVAPNTSDETILLLTLSANARNGQPVTKEWRLRQSVTLLAHGYNEEVVSKALSLPVSSMKSFRRLLTVDSRAKDLRINGWIDLSSSLREMIGTIQLDKVFQVIAETCVLVRPSPTPEFRAFINSVKNAANEQDAFALAQQWSASAIAEKREKDRRGYKRVPAVRNLKTGLVTGIGKVNAFNIHELHATFSTEDDRESLKATTATGIRKLLDIYSRLSSIEHTEELALGILEEFEKRNG